MKNAFLLLSTVLVLFISVNANAQFEAKINPLGALFGSPDISLEYGVAPSFGVEASFSPNFNKYTINNREYKNTGMGVRVAGKYYISPKNGLDKWYVGPYARYKTGTAKVTNTETNNVDLRNVKSTRMAVGFLMGHKWVTKHNIVFEVNGGFGRAFISKYEYQDGETADASNIPLLNWDVVGTFAVGYRFGGKKQQ